MTGDLSKVLQSVQANHRWKMRGSEILFHYFWLDYRNYRLNPVEWRNCYRFGMVYCLVRWRKFECKWKSSEPMIDRLRRFRTDSANGMNVLHKSDTDLTLDQLINSFWVFFRWCLRLDESPAGCRRINTLEMKFLDVYKQTIVVTLTFVTFEATRMTTHESTHMKRWFFLPIDA